MLLHQFKAPKAHLHLFTSIHIRPLTLFASCCFFVLYLNVHVRVCLSVCVCAFSSAYINQPLLQVHLNQQGCIYISRAPLNISQRVGWGALPSVWTMDRLAWHSTGYEYRRQPCITAMAELQLVQRLSSLPSGECFIVLYLTNAGKAFAFPYQVVRIPFDEMRRYRVTNLPRGCCWGVSKVPSLRVAQVSKNKRPPISQLALLAVPNFHPRQPGCTWVGGSWGGVRTANHLKSNQLQSTKGRGLAELFPQSPQNRWAKVQTQSHIQRKRRINLRLCNKNHLVATVIYQLKIRTRTQSPKGQSQTIKKARKEVHSEHWNYYKRHAWFQKLKCWSFNRKENGTTGKYKKKNERRDGCLCSFIHLPGDLVVPLDPSISLSLLLSGKLNLWWCMSCVCVCLLSICGHCNSWLKSGQGYCFKITKIFLWLRW